VLAHCRVQLTWVKSIGCAMIPERISGHRPEESKILLWRHPGLSVFTSIDQVRWFSRHDQSPYGSRVMAVQEVVNWWGWRTGSVWPWVGKTGTSTAMTHHIRLIFAMCNFLRRSWDWQDTSQPLARCLNASWSLICPMISYVRMLI